MRLLQSDRSTRAFRCRVLQASGPRRLRMKKSSPVSPEEVQFSQQFCHGSCLICTLPPQRRRSPRIRVWNVACLTRFTFVGFFFFYVREATRFRRDESSELLPKLTVNEISADAVVAGV